MSYSVGTPMDRACSTVKIEGHPGCLMKKLVDEQAEFGRVCEQAVLCPGPQNSLLVEDQANSA
jgi:hypothetical protein